ncbi:MULTISPECIES: alpha-amylase family glycosyl hydrolase [unclassified Lentimonas]|uniref:alpha-amylase family glycosyl hydrolase n=1 Tax=unclassified Lentimonas TaxID=2630993 RepID=UPI0013280C81|nr:MULTISPECIES: alpha-amylase family glycosyl hydrolase [unclassified Lentimonas]CAA6690599.1 Sucrose phosphorylase (EC [Lentimonas sp. CC10]CAA6695276.1 Sucrose phosphorylase (EC [Lentimonas sp. CC19]CAA7068856.1 Sucrose phosphorylase (EC [Lentimonas sp. CC11]
MLEFDLKYEADRSLERLRPIVHERIRGSSGNHVVSHESIELLDARFERHWPRLFELLYRIYGQHYDFFYHLTEIVKAMVDSWMERSGELRGLDLRRENDPNWFQSERMVGASLYVDLFAGDIHRLREKVPYFKEIGLTYLHLMPLFLAREGNSDGGYAVSDYRSVDPKLGSMQELRKLATELRIAGISLVLDFVFNHTSDDHEWALKAQEGERAYQDYYYLFDDRTMPDRYEETLREIFPTIRRGNFSWHESLQKWIWTSFNSFQWDLKYANPEVFCAMAKEMLYLANTGVEVLRLDAVAFIWKQMGTSCENLPEAHLLIQAFNALCRIVAPSLVFKSEAIVHPDDVVRYISPEECQISYNPTLMALLWEALATREVKLLRQSLSHRQSLPAGSAWLNYLRCHDDIGWSFDNGDAWQVGINPDDHRSFLNAFYTGQFEGSFSRGVPFQHNEETGDMRVSGTMASLIGMEQAITQSDRRLTEMALRRMRMVYGVLCSIGGIPMLFMGEEWAIFNDYSYLSDSDKSDDSRWIHRPSMDWSVIEDAADGSDYRRYCFDMICRILYGRKQMPALQGNQMELLFTEHPHILAYRRWEEGCQIVVLANFSEKSQSIDLTDLRYAGLSHFMRDYFSERVYSTSGTTSLAPYELLWLEEH